MTKVRPEASSSALAEALRKLAAPHAVVGQRERAEGILEAADFVDYHSADRSPEAAAKFEMRIAGLLVSLFDKQLEVLHQLTETAADLASARFDGGARISPPSAIGKKRDRPATNRAKSERRDSTSKSNGSDASRGKCAQTLLGVLAQRSPEPTTRVQLAILSGYSAKSGGYANTLGALRSEKLVTDTIAGLVITEDGKRRSPPFEAMPPPGLALVSWWGNKLGRCESAILHVLERSYPSGLTRERLAELAGYSPTSGGFANALGKLRTLDLVAGLRLSDDLMGGAK